MLTKICVSRNRAFYITVYISGIFILVALVVAMDFFADCRSASASNYFGVKRVASKRSLNFGQKGTLYSSSPHYNVTHHIIQAIYLTTVSIFYNDVSTEKDNMTIVLWFYCRATYGVFRRHWYFWSLL